MAGVQIDFDVSGFREIEGALAAIAAIGRKPGGLLNAIGVQMARNTRARFNAGVDPAGHPWAPLRPWYAEIKRGPRILIGSGMAGGLQGSITHQVRPGEVIWGSNKVYAAIHQFGGVIRPKKGKALVFSTPNGPVFARSVTIPARPYLGLSQDDRRDVLETADDFLRRALRA